MTISMTYAAYFKYTHTHIKYTHTMYMTKYRMPTYTIYIYSIYTHYTTNPARTADRSTARPSAAACSTRSTGCHCQDLCISIHKYIQSISIYTQ